MDNILKKERFSILLGQRIREHREQKGLTQLQLATYIDLNESTLRNYEKGRSMPSIYTLYKISVCLDIYISDLVSKI